MPSRSVWMISSIRARERAQPFTFSRPISSPSRVVMIVHGTPHHLANSQNGHITMNGSTMRKISASRVAKPVSQGIVFHHQRRTDQLDPSGSVTVS